jgi:hypothetical protein
MRHPLQIAGIYYPSRHDNDRFNVALFKRPHLLDQIEDADLLPANVKRWKRRSRRGLVYGPPVLLQEHPENRIYAARIESGDTSLGRRSCRRHFRLSLPAVMVLPVVPSLPVRYSSFLLVTNTIFLADTKSFR